VIDWDGDGKIGPLDTMITLDLLEEDDGGGGGGCCGPTVAMVLLLALALGGAVLGILIL
jgi:hypothetical protein